MISRIELQNFQSHVSLEFDLEPITCLVGDSDSGKSAVIRALRLLTFNQPSGTKFIKFGKKKTKVSVICDGKRITRIRGKRNLYKLDNQTFEAFGTGKVPTPIQGTLNLSEENFQFQLNPHFWVDDSPAKLAQNLNKIVALSSIDRASAKVISMIREKTQRIKLLEEEQDLLENEWREIKWTIPCEAEYATLEKMKGIGQKKSHRIASLASQLQSASSLQSTLDRLTGATSEGKELIASYRRYAKMAHTTQQIEKSITEYEKIKVIDPAMFSEFADFSTFKMKADAHAENVRWIELQLIKYKEHIEAIRQNVKSLKFYQKHKAKLRRCPTCGQKLKTDNPSHSHLRTYTLPSDRQSRDKRRVIG